MKRLYPNLAWTGIRKNKKLYLPYILTCIGMVMMFYIVAFLYYCPWIQEMRGGTNIKFTMSLGRSVIGVFALIFLFYTNSFLTRRRKKEFGLYNILGMGKRNIARILFWETLMVAAISLTVGLLAGIVFSKFAELGLLNVLQMETSFTLSVTWEGILWSVVLFGAIYFLLYLNALRQLHFSNTIALLHSEYAGEKPPKANRFIALLGAVLLGIAYYIAVSIQNPVEALILFFAAVILVILGTYLVFISGSVVICRLLQKNRKYYYNPKHFVSVSSMAYRMKRNGAGLASICILSTMVLVMISSTTCLYAGSEDMLRAYYPRNITVDVQMKNLSDMGAERIEELRQLAVTAAQDNGAEMDNILDYRAVVTAGLLTGEYIETDVSVIDSIALSDYSNVYQVFIVPLEDYNRLMGEHETLEAGEALVYSTRPETIGSALTVGNAEKMSVKRVLTEFVDDGMNALQTFPAIFIFVQSLEEYAAPLTSLAASNGAPIAKPMWYYGFDLQAEDEAHIQIADEIEEKLHSIQMEEDGGLETYLCQSAVKSRSALYAMNGGFFFLAILLGAVFLVATVVIIYYKQVSEGFEDQSRFDIMQKIGMTKRDIRKSINSQVITVFFLPIMIAGVHLIFAFPFIYRLLQLFYLSNRPLLIAVTAVSFAVFAAFYSLVYRITSNAYYAIVSK